MLNKQFNYTTSSELMIMEYYDDFSVNYETKEDFVYVPIDAFPSTLKNSYIYKNIDKTYQNTNIKIPILSNVYNNEMNLSILYDMLGSLCELMKIMPDGNIPYLNYDFIIKNKKYITTYFPKLKEKFNSKTFNFINEIEILLNNSENSDHQILEKIIIHNHKNLFVYCLERNLFNITPSLAFDIATKHYNIDILDYLYKTYKKDCKFSTFEF